MLLTSILVALQLLHDCHSVPADTTTGLDLSSRRDILVKRSLVLAEAASHGGFSKDLAGGAKIEKTADAAEDSHGMMASVETNGISEVRKNVFTTEPVKATKDVATATSYQQRYKLTQKQLTSHEKDLLVEGLLRQGGDSSSMSMRECFFNMKNLMGHLSACNQDKFWKFMEKHDEVIGNKALLLIHDARKLQASLHNLLRSLEGAKSAHMIVAVSRSPAVPPVNYYKSIREDYRFLAEWISRLDANGQGMVWELLEHAVKSSPPIMSPPPGGLAEPHVSSSLLQDVGVEVNAYTDTERETGSAAKYEADYEALKEEYDVVEQPLLSKIVSKNEHTECTPESLAESFENIQKIAREWKMARWEKMWFFMEKYRESIGNRVLKLMNSRDLNICTQQFAHELSSPGEKALLRDTVEKAPPIPLLEIYRPIWKDYEHFRSWISTLNEPEREMLWRLLAFKATISSLPELIAH
ncbi:hypothetical protein PCANC_20769 [Puccinia coronata f. sp. avenae]|uniref:RxLR effector candidate protein n=1 Tax=Puccinia coronata f. sp. avenae TaxID=200324 RepID=A0A2N5TRF7_9BASI|nr:hypothetical protein PCANC_20769 [Puccinia coronata f. sp. avenae]